MTKMICAKRERIIHIAYSTVSEITNLCVKLVIQLQLDTTQAQKENQHDNFL